ncbi:hypothetical protein [uncultured Ilyobacter sp.]|uniref:hypothetical protein n=1 Tax=uncultured Ilyobacter sp. TaxID=544433 RepID=UPI002AA606A0|nr:hypothetical protein [uncultured Ilyobacter sp.]
MILFLGERKIFNTGNSKGITIPNAVIKEIEKDHVFEIVDVFYNSKTKEIVLRAKH